MGVLHESLGKGAISEPTIMVKYLRPLSLIAILLLSACGTTPACGDAETLDLLGEIIEETFQGSVYGREFRPMVDYEIRGIRTLDRDMDADSYECTAKLEFRLKEGHGSKTIEQTFEYEVYSVLDKDGDFEVNYDENIKRGILKAATAWSMGWR